MSDEIKENPAILLAGGKPKSISLMAAMMSRGFGGMQKPQVAYIGTATNDNPVFFRMMKSFLVKAGAGKVTLLRIANKKPDLDNIRKILSDSDIVFLSGGEVEDGMSWLKKHGLVSVLRELYKAGKRFMGVSAGVIMMGTHWVHWDVEGDDSTSKLFDCLGIIPVLFDVHGEDEDWVELKAALKLLGNGSRAYGLPRDCMISADSSGALINLEKEYLVFQNNNGQIQII